MNLRSLAIVLLNLQGILSNSTQSDQSELDQPQPSSVPGMNPNNVISPAEINEILTIVNNARRTVTPPATNQKEVVWNTSLANTLDQFVIDNGGEIFFEDDTEYPVTIPNIKYPWIGLNLLKRPQFAAFTDQCFFWVHDTNDNGPFKVADIFTYRVKQKDCFEYSHCSTTEYTSYETCVTNPAYLINNSTTQGKCVYFNWFYVPLILANVESIACVSTGVPGPFTPNNQPNSFWCYACTKAPILFSNDVPYTAGPRASGCATTDYPVPKDGLCTQAPTKQRLRTATM